MIAKENSCLKGSKNFSLYISYSVLIDFWLTDQPVNPPTMNFECEWHLARLTTAFLPEDAHRIGFSNKNWKLIFLFHLSVHLSILSNSLKRWKWNHFTYKAWYKLTEHILWFKITFVRAKKPNFTDVKWQHNNVPRSRNPLISVRNEKFLEDWLALQNFFEYFWSMRSEYSSAEICFILFTVTK